MIVHPLTESQQALAAEALEESRKIADRYARIFPQYADDMESSAAWGAVKAAASYEPNRDTTWRTWCKLNITNELRHFVTSYYRKHRAAWTDESQAAAENDAIESDDRCDFELGEILRMLPEKHAELCRLVYESGITPSMAGVAMGYSAKHGRRMHVESIETLRSLMMTV